MAVYAVCKRNFRGLLQGSVHHPPLFQPVRNQLCFSATGLQPVARRARFAQKLPENHPDLGLYCVEFLDRQKFGLFMAIFTEQLIIYA